MKYHNELLRSIQLLRVYQINIIITRYNIYLVV